MYRNKLYLNLNGGYIEIGIIDTPITRKWVNVFKKYDNHISSNKLNKELIVLPQTELIHSWGIKPGEDPDLVQPYVDKINKYIEEVNTSIEGMPFPWRAYNGMPWQQTNLIHRGFTTGSRTKGYWYLNLTQQERLESKIKVYEKGEGIVHDYVRGAPHFKVLDEKKFYDACHQINNGVHSYEGWHSSERAVKHLQSIPDVEHIRFEWNVYHPETKVHLYFFGERATYEEVKQSVDINTFHEYDVFVGKSITGKSYGFAYTEMDDPLEYDITNLDTINGTVQIYKDVNKMKKLFTSSPFQYWCEESGLEPEMYLPIPIGKILSRSVDLEPRFNPNSTNKHSDGTDKCFAPYDSVKAKLMDQMLI